MSQFDEFILPILPPTIWDDLLDWVIKNWLNILMFIFFLVSAGSFALVLWKQDWHDKVVWVYIKEDARLSIVYKEAMDVNGKSDIKVHFYPDKKVNYTWKINLKIIASKPEYMNLDKPYDKDFTVSPEMADDGGEILPVTAGNPPSGIGPLGFTIQIQPDGRSPILVPIILELQPYRTVPLVSAIISLLLVFVTAGGKKYLSIG